MDNTWFNIISIVLPSLVTLFVGYWQIRTMRELARQESDKPRQDSFFSHYFQERKSRRFLFTAFIILLFVLLAFDLAKFLWVDEPITKLVVLRIAASLMNITLLLILYFLNRVLDILKTIQVIYRTMDSRLDSVQANLEPKGKKKSKTAAS